MWDRGKCTAAKGRGEGVGWGTCHSKGGVEKEKLPLCGGWVGEIIIAMWAIVKEVMEVYQQLSKKGAGQGSITV